MNELIKKLVESYGPSGFEGEIRSIINEEIEEFVDEITIDAMGNLIAHKQGDGSGLRVMIAAHMDEIGVMISHVTEKGFLRFTNIGGLYPHTLMGARVQFADGTVGVIYSEKLENRKSVHPLDKHYIDVGATSRDDCDSVLRAEHFLRVGPKESFASRAGKKVHIGDKLFQTFRSLVLKARHMWFISICKDSASLRSDTTLSLEYSSWKRGNDHL